MGGRFERGERLEHQTLGVQRQAVRSEDYWDFKPEQRVKTIDGVTGVVKHVEDGPFPGNEEYHVVLDQGMGGGRYTASQLSPAPITTEAMEQTAATDYPELAQILVERPDPALQHVTAGKNPFADDDSSDDEDDSSDDEGDSDDDEDSDDDAPPWAKKSSALFASLIVTAAADSDFRFHVTAAWRDVVAKAKRLRAEGRLRVTMASEGYVFGEVKGDHHVYETGLQRMPGKVAAHAWSCGCKWGAYHWGADDDFSRFAGRMCSHALALQYEAQSRGMFGRDINADEEKPTWVPRHVVVRYDIDADTNRLAPATARKLASWDAPEPSMWDMDDERHGRDYEGERQAKSDEWDSIHEGLGDIHRGVNVHLRPEDHAIVHDESRPLHERAQHLMKSLPHSDLARGREGLGRHWTDNEGVAESFGEMDGRPNRHGTHPTSVIFHAEKPDRHAIDEDPDQSDGEIYGYHDHGESEIPLHPGAGVNLKGVSWKNMGTPDEDFRTVKGDGLFDHLWEHQRHDFPGGHRAHASLRQAPMSVVARAAVAAGEDIQEVQLALHTVKASWDSWDDDEREDDTHRTDWDRVYPHLNGVHRGMSVALPSDVHANVHDPARPVSDRAHALLKEVSNGREGLGMHWSSNPEQASHYAHVSHPEPTSVDSGHAGTHVILHAKTPDRASIETDDDTLRDRQVIGYDHHEDAEVPVSEGEPVHITGVSWKEPHKHEWTRHNFDAPQQHTANANAPFGEPSGTSYQLPKAPGATSPRRPWENPASSGPLAGADPVGWNRQLPLESYASLEDSALFEPGGAEATLHDEPEGALPSTDGVQIPSEDEALTPSMAGLKRQALKDFTLAEQQALINEGEGVRAANLDRLDIKGTHYADLEQVLAAQEDDTTWLI
ncbi:hypothetical protein [Streptomyces griseoaurantiacus]|uniref:hypothetical protein n=1 Tax=Streptomyces griseoaurantiacus TaxID=68213 RepID=UPI0036A5C8C2